MWLPRSKLAAMTGVLCTADADLALKLFPFRKEVQRAGSLRIAGAK